MRSAWGTSLNKIHFCVAAVALGCRALVERCLGPKEDWEKGAKMDHQVAVEAYAGVLSLSDERNQSPITVEKREKVGGKLLLDWVEVNMAVRRGRLEWRSLKRCQRCLRIWRWRNQSESRSLRTSDARPTYGWLSTLIV